MLEAEALDTSPLIGKPMRDLRQFDSVRVGAIIRGDEVLIPRGDTEIQANDRIVICARQEDVRKVEQMFRVSLEFF